MKTVFDNAMVAHVWAQNTQYEGRSHNGQFFFEGRRIFSYGRHFLAGLILADGAYLVNSDTYSITTGRHMNYVRSAIRSSAVRMYVASLTRIGEFFDSEGVLTNRAGLIRFLSGVNDLGDYQAFMEHALTKKEVAVIGRAVAKRKKEKEAKQAKERKALAAKIVSAFKGKEWDFEAESFGLPRLYDDCIAGYATQYDLTKLDSNDGLSEFVKSLNRYLHYARKYGNAEHVKKYVWPPVKAFRARLAAKNARRERDQALFVLQAQKARIREGVKAMAAHLATPGTPGEDGAYGNYLAAAYSAVDEMQRIARGKTIRARLIPAMQDFAIYRELIIARYNEHVAEVRKAQAKKDMEKKAEFFARWNQGETISSYNLPIHPRGHEYAYLRVRGDNVETSRGASVPLSHAIRLYRFMKAIKQPWEGAQRVGHFTLTSISDDTATIGCHKLHMSDMDALAQLVGVYGEA